MSLARLLAALDAAHKKDTTGRMLGNTFRNLCGPGVYLIIKAHKVLYVGSSNCILHRISALHEAHVAFEQCEEVLMIPCHTTHDARNLEEAFITELQPEYNIRGGSADIAHRLDVTRQHAIRFEKHGARPIPIEDPPE
jgi:excinuclease UvrABC nuclease subunit